MAGRLATLLALLVLLSACAAPPPTATATPSPTHDPASLNVTAFLDLSGGRAPKGDAQRKALQLWVDQQQGRSAAPRLKLRVVDVAGSDARLLIELHRIAEEDLADAIVIGVPIAPDDTLLRAIELARRPVLFTVPLGEPAGRGAGGRWTFGLAPTPEQIAAVDRGLLPAGPLAGTVSAIIVTDESPAAVRERTALQAEFAARGGAVPTVLRIQSGERDLFPTRLRPALAVSVALYFAGPAGSYLAPARLLPSPTATTGFVTVLSFLTDASDLGQLHEAAPVTRWPGTRNIITGQYDPTTGSGAGRAAFARAYTDRHGPPTTQAALAYDALGLIAYAADRVGSAPERLRERIESGTFAGIATSYAFTPSRHAAFDASDLVLLAWDGGQPVLGRPAFALPK
jgi:ABC-type branched-subunit amino acid transport system substrate-binding protein